MKILIVSQYFWPETFRVNEIATYLVDKGHDVTVLTAVPNYPEGQTLPAYKRNPKAYSEYLGAKIIRVPIITRGKNSGVRLLANYLSFVASGLTIGAVKLRREQFDVILAIQLSPVTAVIPAILQRRLKRAPLAMWILDLWPETLSAVGATRSQRVVALIGRIVTYIYNRCDCILVQSRAFIDSVERRSSKKRNIVYWPAWAEETFDKDLQSVTIAQELAPYRDTFNILFAGNIGEAQDMPSVLQAALQLKENSNIRWLLLGDGRAASETAKQISALGLEERVVMLGRFPIERMSEFFKGADALLVSLKPNPVFSMTVPGKIQSYMRAGLPLIGMLDGEGARVIQAAGAGLTCAAGDSLGLSKAVAEIASWSPEQRRIAGERAQTFCKTEFDRATQLGALERHLTALSYR